MGLTETDIHMITVTILGHIENIHIDSPEDITNIMFALSSIRTNSPPPPFLPSQMLSKFEAITDYIDPDFMAVRPENYQEFRILVNHIIDGRMDYFRSLTPQNIFHIISEQTSRRQTAIAMQEKMRLQKPPEGDSRTISEMQMLRYFEQTGRLGSGPEISIIYRPEFYHLIESGLIPERFARSLNLPDLRRLAEQFNNPEIRLAVQQRFLCGYDIYTLLQYGPDRPLQAVRNINYPPIRALIDSGDIAAIDVVHLSPIEINKLVSHLSKDIY